MADDMQFRPEELKKKTVRIPPQEVLDGASPQMRWLIDRDVDHQHAINDIKDAVIVSDGATNKNLVLIKDQLKLVNGRVGKNEAETNKLKIAKLKDDEERAAREQAIRDLAISTEQKRKADEAYRQKVFRYLFWIITLTVTFSGSAFAEKILNFIWGSSTALYGVFILLGMTAAMVFGIILGRRKVDTKIIANLPSTPSDSSV